MPRLLLAIALILTAALAIGVSAEFADLNQPVLIAIGLPAIAVSAVLASAALPVARPPAVFAAGVVAGLALGVAGEGTYLALHFARGGELNFESYDTQREMALALLGIHTLVGLTGGVIVGAALAAAFAFAAIMRRAPERLP
jgi:hypothetical protein